jgi:hypothetical protein
MNEFDRNERFQKMLLFQSKAAIYFEVALYFILLLMACFWWYGEPGEEVGKSGGCLAVVMLWVYTFNRFQSAGLNCIKHPRAIFFQIPIAIIATIGFFVGVYYT